MNEGTENQRKKENLRKREKVEVREKSIGNKSKMQETRAKTAKYENLGLNLLLVWKEEINPRAETSSTTKMYSLPFLQWVCRKSLWYLTILGVSRERRKKRLEKKSCKGGQLYREYVWLWHMVVSGLVVGKKEVLGSWWGGWLSVYSWIV